MNESPVFKGIVVVGMLMIFGLFGVAMCGTTVNNVTGRSHDLAQSAAGKYLRETGIKGKASCVNTDSDGDGYLSCSYVTEDGNIHPLECAGAMTLNEGCRPPKAIINNK